MSRSVSCSEKQRCFSLSTVCLLPTLLEQTFLPAPTHVCLPCGRKYLSAFAVWLLLKTRHFHRGLASALKLIKESRRTKCFELLDFKRNIQVRPRYEESQRRRIRKIIFCALLKQSNVAVSTFMSI